MSYLSALTHDCAGSTACVSIICWRPVSSICTRSGRSPLDNPDRNLFSVSAYVVWLTSVTRTSLWDELNRSASLWRVSSLARCMECQYVISTGLLLAFFRALRGHFADACVGAAAAPGTATPVTVSATAAHTAANRGAS